MNTTLLADSDAEAASSAAYTSWRDERARVIAAASVPAYAVQTVTSRAAVASNWDHAPVTIEHVDEIDETRPGGRRFGALVHAVLAMVQLDAQRPEIEHLAAVQGSLAGASPGEEAAAISAVLRTLAHPVLRRAAGVDADRVHREAPVMMTLDDGTILEGVVDLAFEESGESFCGWTIVDFKTAREVRAESVPGEYVRQVALYCRVVVAATKAPARAILLVI